MTIMGMAVYQRPGRGYRRGPNAEENHKAAKAVEALIDAIGTPSPWTARRPLWRPGRLMTS